MMVRNRYLIALLIVGGVTLLAFFAIYDWERDESAFSEPPETVTPNNLDHVGASEQTSIDIPVDTDDYLQYLDAELGKSAEQMLNVFDRWGGTLARINEQTRRLENETLEESLAHYYEVDMFYWPGMFHGPDIIASAYPLTLDVGAEEVSIVLSNRRTSKLLEELQQIPAAKAGRLIEAQLRESLREYRRLFKADILDSPLLRNRSGAGGGFTYRASDYPDGSPTLQGLRKSIFGLVLVAGMLELTDARGAVLEVAAEAILQRDDFYVQQGVAYNSRSAYIAIATASLYNRQILASGLAGVGGADRTAVEREYLAAGTRYFAALPPEISASVEEKYPWRTLRLTSYRAFISPFDLPASRGAGSAFYLAPDYSGWSYSFTFAPWVDDEAFDSIVNLVK